jgi:DNA-binding NarL/FixJ family response regulator
MDPFKVYLLDDHKIIRDGIKVILKQNGTYQVVGEEGDPVKFMEVFDRINMDILLLDLTLPTISGFQIIPKIKKERPEVKIVILSMHNDPEIMQRCLIMGVHGYLPKDIDSVEFIKALDKVRGGGIYTSPSFPLPKNVMATNNVLLTQREIEILIIFSNGFSSKQIAKELSISIRTVETHRLNIMKKLGTSNSAETISVAAKLNLI